MQPNQLLFQRKFEKKKNYKFAKLNLANINFALYFFFNSKFVEKKDEAIHAGIILQKK